MPELEYFVVAESHSIDRSTGAISIFNVFGEVKCESFPHTVQRLIAVASWLNTPEEVEAGEEHQLQITVNQGEKVDGPHNINFECGSEFQDVILQWHGLVVQNEGKMKIEVALDGKHKASHTINFKKKPKSLTSASG